jgi:hypothetical protein
MSYSLNPSNATVSTSGVSGGDRVGTYTYSVVPTGNYYGTSRTGTISIEPSPIHLVPISEPVQNFTGAPIAFEYYVYGVYPRDNGWVIHGQTEAVEPGRYNIDLFIESENYIEGGQMNIMWEIVEGRGEEPPRDGGRGEEPPRDGGR